MTELISYTRDDFMRVKEVCDACPETKSKYESLFVCLECFNNNFVVKHHVKRGEQVRPHRAQGVQPHSLMHRKHFVRQPRRIVNGGDSSHIRKAKSVLNIINASNFDKLYNKLKFVVSNENVNEVVPLVLEVGVQQRFYIGIFINILMGMAKEYKAEVEAHAARFVSGFIDDVLTLELSEEEAMSEYDRFCAEQKLKQHKVSSGVMALHIIKSGLFKMKLQEFVDSLVMACKEKRTETVFDVVISILAENKGLNGSRAIVLERRELDCFAGTTKLRFMLDDIFGQR